MKLMEKILSEENLKMAIKKVKQTKGAPGVDKMSVEQWFEQYRPMQVKRVYIPKQNRKTRPLGIPCTWDRLIQQCIK